MTPEQRGTRPDDTPVSPKRTHWLDLLGRRFGRLKVVAETTGRGANGAIVWLCDCRCGSRGVPVLTHNLTSGNTQSCGCWQVERTRECHPARRTTCPGSDPPAAALPHTRARTPHLED